MPPQRRPSWKSRVREGGTWGQLASVDLDADGVADLLVSNFGTGEVLGFLSNNRGTIGAGDADIRFRSWVSGATLRADPVGDVDGDGRSDIGLQLSDTTAAVGAVVVHGQSDLTPEVLAEPNTIRISASARLGRMFADFATRESTLPMAVWQVSTIASPALGATYDPFTDASFEVFRDTGVGGYHAVQSTGWFGTTPGQVLAAQLPEDLDHGSRGMVSLVKSAEMAGSSSIASDDVELH